MEKRGNPCSSITSQTNIAHQDGSRKIIILVKQGTYQSPNGSMDTNKRRQTTERQTKKRKKHNVVTVTVDVGSEEESVRAHGSSSKAPTESIEVDQGDLQVADELIEIRKLILEGDHPELEVNSADDIEEHVMNKGNLLASCANNIDRRITELNLPWTGTTLQKMHCQVGCPRKTRSWLCRKPDKHSRMDRLFQKPQTHQSSLRLEREGTSRTNIQSRKLGSLRV